MRGVGNVPFRDESSGGAATPEGAVEAWLAGGRLGPDYVMDADKERAWVLRADGTAEALVTVKLTEGGYFDYGYETCG
jgi:hypothetical protein